MTRVRRALALGLLLTAVTALVSPLRAADPPPRVAIGRIAGAAKVARAATGADGTVHVLYDTASGPMYARSTDDGATFSAGLAVVDDASRRPGLVFSGEDLAVGPDGRVHAALSTNAWKLKLPKEDWGFHCASLAPGAKAFAAVRSINRKPSEGFSLAAGDRGCVVAAFLSGKLYAMTSRDDGATFSPAAEFDSSWDPCDCCTTSVTFGRDGRAALLYREQTGNERDVHAVVWNPRSAAKPVRTRVSGEGWKTDACPMTYFSLRPAGDGYVAAWPTKGRIFVARLDKDGAVQTPGEVRTPGKAGIRTGVLALGAADGACLVLWKDQDVLGWQAYDAALRPVGEPGSAASPSTGAAAAVLRDGRFLVFP